MRDEPFEFSVVRFSIKTKKDAVGVFISVSELANVWQTDLFKKDTWQKSYIDLKMHALALGGGCFGGGGGYFNSDTHTHIILITNSKRFKVNVFFLFHSVCLAAIATASVTVVNIYIYICCLLTKCEPPNVCYDMYTGELAGCCWLYIYI